MTQITRLSFSTNCFCIKFAYMKGLIPDVEMVADHYTRFTSEMLELSDSCLSHACSPGEHFIFGIIQQLVRTQKLFSPLRQSQIFTNTQFSFLFECRRTHCHLLVVWDMIIFSSVRYQTISKGLVGLLEGLKGMACGSDFRTPCQVIISFCFKGSLFEGRSLMPAIVTLGWDCTDVVFSGSWLGIS